MRTDEVRPPEETPPSHFVAPIREAVALGVVGLLALAGFLWWMNRNDAAARLAPTITPPADITRADFLGNEACAECHTEITLRHQRHGHHRTLRPAADRGLSRELSGQRFADPEQPDVWWTFLLDDNRFSVSRQEGQRVDRLPIDFAFGSGYHATTFISLLDDDPQQPVLREHRLTFRGDRSVLVTPGQGLPHPLDGTDSLGRIVRGELAIQCFRCHVTMTSDHDLGLLEVQTMIPSITCERCHGPGRSHVNAARAGLDGQALAMPFGPGRATTESLMLLCGTCHRHPSQAPPGSLRPDNLELARFQPVGLMQSACYTRSRGALDCTTCHDPHAHTRSDPASYTPACLSCHRPSQPNQVACPIAPSLDCTTCHMPRVDAGQGVHFADHWIRVRDDVPTDSPQPIAAP